MNQRVTPPTIIAEIRTHDDLIEALRAAKDMRGLSNRWCDEIGDLTTGQTDKVLGPTRAKGLSRFLFSMYHTMFAVKLVMVIDDQAEARMAPKWEGRDQSNVRIDSGRVSKSLVERAKPLVLKDFAKAGGTASGAMRTGSHGSEIMRKVAKRGWRTRRKTMRERLLERAQLTSPSTDKRRSPNT